MTEGADGIKTGDALVRLLEGYGVDTIFGIPGVHTIEMYRRLSASPVRHVLTRHEQGAGFMADGYARATGRPGVCFVITGPGVTNVMTAMGQAYSDSVPMLVISAVVAARDIGQRRGRLHDMKNQSAAAETVAEFSATAHTPGEIPELIAKAFAVFASSRPRPVHIQIPIDVLSETVTADWRPRTMPARPGPDPAAVAAAADRLAASRRPVMIVGGGAAGAAAEVRRLAETTGAVAIPTIAGKGTLPDSHPNCLGARLPQPAVHELIANADCVLAVGTELAETDLWTEEIDIPAGLIRIDIDPSELADQYAAEIAIRADAGAALAAIADALEGGEPAGDAATKIAALKQRIAAEEGPLRRTHRAALEALRAAAPADAILATDMTQIAYAGNEIFPVERPRSWLHPAGFGTLGYALPAAIGARLGAPERPVIALAGDYGLQYTLQEMATARELNLPVVLVVWNNDALGQIRDDMVRGNMAPVAVEQWNPDFRALARAYGWAAERPESLVAFGQAVAAALEADGPTLIELHQSVAERG